ncbi:metallophosphoesterase [Candidatus Pacearchaeota archaeon]|nr:metallophosphoesterase [Candidatus Pacearchaeota archaeon]
MVKFCAVGDPHGDLKRIRKVSKNVDFYLVTGDLGRANLARNIFFENIKRSKKGLAEKEVGVKEKKKIHDEIHYSTLGVLRYLANVAPVYSIQGNVGITTIVEARERSEEDGFKHLATRKVIDDNSKMHLVKNVIRNLGGVRVGFLEYFVDECWVREFASRDKEKMKVARKESLKAKKILERFGKVDILVCHQPPYGFLDKISGEYGAPKGWHGKHAGSRVILDYIRKHQPRFVFCGHIHEGEGKIKIGKSEVFNLGVGGSFCFDV